MYAVPLTQVPLAKDESSVYRFTLDGNKPHPLVRRLPSIEYYRCNGSALKEAPSEILQSVWEIVENRAKINPKGMFLGYRPTNSDGSFGSYKFFNNEEVANIARAFGLALTKKNGGIIPTVRFEENLYQQSFKVLGIWSRNRIEWAAANAGANAFNIVCIPFYDALGLDSVAQIVNTTQLTAICAETHRIPDLICLSQRTPFLKTVILFDKKPSKDDVDLAKNAGITLFYFHDLVEEFAELSQTVLCSRGRGEDVAMLIFTSGTTGQPKGAMHTNYSITASVAGYVYSQNRLNITSNDVVLSYLPLAHVYEYAVYATVSYLEAKIGFYQGEIAKLVDDLNALKPSVMVTVPRVLYRIYDQIMSALKRKPAVIQHLVNYAVSTKVEAYNTYGTVHHWFWDMMFFNKIKGLFGGNLRVLPVGGAAMDTTTLKRLASLLCVNICEGWGMTEVGTVFIQSQNDYVVGTIGGPFCSAEFKIRSIPDMNCYADRFPPRGELLVRGESTMKGYFMLPEETSQVISSDGWLLTGDVVEFQHSGAVKIIDRFKCIFKLQQGEYIAPEKIENIYQRAPIVSQIFVYGNSTQTCPVALVIPDEHAVMLWAARENEKTKTFESLVESDAELKKKILKEMNTVADKQLLGFEKVKAICLDSVQFSVQNGLLTPTFKLVRKKVEDKYKNQLVKTYQSITWTK